MLKLSEKQMQKRDGVHKLAFKKKPMMTEAVEDTYPAECLVDLKKRKFTEPKKSILIKEERPFFLGRPTETKTIKVRQLEYVGDSKKKKEKKEAVKEYTRTATIKPQQRRVRFLIGEKNEEMWAEKHRPEHFNQIVGQEAAKTVLIEWLQQWDNCHCRVDSKMVPRWNPHRFGKN